jgi:hypothetical protein
MCVADSEYFGGIMNARYGYECAALVSGAIFLSACAADVSRAGEAVTELEGCFTSGELADIDGASISIEDPQTRGVVPGTATAIDVLQQATQTFTYLGETEETIPLGSGEIRHQIGLKLRSQDPCNLLYVMWRVEDQRIVVQIKRNPGQSTSSACGNNGYGTVRDISANVPAVAIDSSHTLYARVRNQWLRVYADGVLLWEGSLVTTATPHGADFVGDFGWRTDNVRAWMELDGVSDYAPECE